MWRTLCLLPVTFFPMLIHVGLPYWTLINCYFDLKFLDPEWVSVTNNLILILVEIKERVSYNKSATMPSHSISTKIFWRCYNALMHLPGVAYPGRRKALLFPTPPPPPPPSLLPKERSCSQDIEGPHSKLIKVTYLLLILPVQGKFLTAILSAKFSKDLFSHLP